MIQYIYNFSDFTDSDSAVEIINCRTAKRYVVNVRLDDKQFIRTAVGCISPLIADLVDIAGAVFISDWLLPRNLHESYEIRVTLPVRNPYFFNQSWILEELRNLLRWYTDDVWYFDFQTRSNDMREAERSPKILFDESVEVALWSGGLDSLAGLCHRIVANPPVRYTLLGTGSNTQMLGKQSEIVEALQNKGIKGIQLIQVPIHLSYPYEKPPTNDMFRARGFAFKLLGAICALLENQHILHIYENGIGAINLPFTRAETGLAHTRSVHPISLLKTGEFVSKMIGKSFMYENPYLFVTKSQMCSSIVQYADLAYRTSTCDGRHRQSDLPSQCGYCSSCLLRRMALHIALGEDKTNYVATYCSGDYPLLNGLDFRAMDIQANKLNGILNEVDPWLSLLMEYPQLRELSVELAAHSELNQEAIKTNLMHLYRKHNEEWVEFRKSLQV